MGTVDLTPREWEVLDLIRERVPPFEMAGLLGMTPQGRSNVFKRLKGKGVITTALPPSGKVTEQYPWEVNPGVDVRYKPALPPTAVLRAGYSHESTKDLSVPPIRVVRWPAGGWEVQGLRTLRRGGGKPSNAIPAELVVWCIAPRLIIDGKDTIAFDAPLRRPWAESHTRDAFGPIGLPGSELTGLTLMIAAVCAVPAVLDMSRVERR